MKQSKIFTQAELKALNKRLEGNKQDNSGIYAGRVKPKLLELLKWFDKKKDIQKLLK